MQKKKLILMGGFLGAGKTTLQGATAGRLQRQGAIGADYQRSGQCQPIVITK